MRVFSWIFPSFGLLRGVRCFETDVSELPIDTIFKAQTIQEAYLLEFCSTAVEAYDRADYFLLLHKIFYRD
jgi:hypothetical protein